VLTWQPGLRPVYIICHRQGNAGLYFRPPKNLRENHRNRLSGVGGPGDGPRCACEATFYPIFIRTLIRIRIEKYDVGSRGSDRIGMFDKLQLCFYLPGSWLTVVRGVRTYDVDVGYVEESEVEADDKDY
jgi:hypothetical protein